jgi:hypothetical protein
MTAFFPRQLYQPVIFHALQHSIARVRIRDWAGLTPPVFHPSQNFQVGFIVHGSPETAAGQE